MTEMREWWANYYPDADGVDRIGGKFKTRNSAALMAGRWAAFRIHVRLKPEGAPKRYASEANRRAWELYPKVCSQSVFCGDDAGMLVSYCGERP